MKNTEQTKHKVLIVGCGDLGIRTAKLLVNIGREVVGARRKVSALPEYITPLALNLSQPETMEAVARQDWQVVIVTLTADDYTEKAYKETYVQGLNRLLQVLERRSSTIDKATRPLVLFASSTSVYHQDDGSCIDENSETAPSSFSGRCMLEAEQLLAESLFPSVAVRFGGIYGSGRGGRLLTQLAQGKICPDKPLKYSNRIHIEDCAALLVHLIQRHERSEPLSPIYLAVDNEPTPIREVMEWLASQMDIKLSGLTVTDSIQRGGNKRCKNKQLLEIGFQFNHASYRQGYQSVLEEYVAGCINQRVE